MIWYAVSKIVKDFTFKSIYLSIYQNPLNISEFYNPGGYVPRSCDVWSYYLIRPVWLSRRHLIFKTDRWDNDNVGEIKYNSLFWATK